MISLWNMKPLVQETMTQDEHRQLIQSLGQTKYSAGNREPPPLDDRLYALISSVNPLCGERECVRILEWGEDRIRLRSAWGQWVYHDETEDYETDLLLEKQQVREPSPQAEHLLYKRLDSRDWTYKADYHEFRITDLFGLEGTWMIYAL